jgi:hypothetical protein
MMRNLLYLLLNLSNWIRAAKRGRLPQRAVRHALGRASGKAIGRITR